MIFLHTYSQSNFRCGCNCVWLSQLKHDRMIVTKAVMVQDNRSCFPYCNVNKKKLVYLKIFKK